MVEVVGRNTFHTAACHCHSGIGFETCHTEEGYQRSGNIFTDAATIGIIHLGIVKGITFAFAHRDAGVTDIVGNPVGEDGYLFHFCFLPFDKLVYLFLCFRQWSKTSVIFVNLIEP